MNPNNPKKTPGWVLKTRVFADPDGSTFIFGFWKLDPDPL
jgi:hypothetical protein